MKTYILVLVGLVFSAFQISDSARHSNMSRENTGMPDEHVQAKKKIIFIAGACSHGPGEHEHHAGCLLLAKELNNGLPDEVSATVFQGWPADTTQLNDASAIVLYMDGGGGHLALKHRDHLKILMQRGVGLTCLHYAVEVPANKGGPEFTDWLGGYFETYWSVNPHWTANFQSIPITPVTRGVRPFEINDEWYFHMRFRQDMKGVTSVLHAIPPVSTLQGPDGPRSGNEFIRKEVGKPQTVAWITERENGGRSFGFTGGHFHKNWANENVRKLVLNGIAWTAHVPIPVDGFPTGALTDNDLQANLDLKPCR
jgi:type 1 glutamine amidotransferase